jgi:DNA-binding response OmpR family regulator
MRILVIEDEAETAKLLKKGLGEEPARRGLRSSENAGLDAFDDDRRETAFGQPRAVHPGLPR